MVVAPPADTLFSVPLAVPELPVVAVAKLLFKAVPAIPSVLQVPLVYDPLRTMPKLDRYVTWVGKGSLTDRAVVGAPPAPFCTTMQCQWQRHWLGGL